MSEPVKFRLVAITEINGGTMVVALAGDAPIVGVDTIHIGVDNHGTYMDVRLRKFVMGESESGSAPDIETHDMEFR